MTQRVTLWKRLIEQVHVAQVGSIKALAKLPRQLLGQQGRQALAIAGALLSALFELHDGAAHLPAGLHLDHVHRPQDATARLGNQLTQLPDQRRKIARRYITRFVTNL
ncbi:hypothetical protein [Melaminivora suipulveris]|uniref:hypothetical protein n=1 Tax=Melaminivora suipulveris TaxID=2109913 RepID=UPI001F16B324|nr:hypothetical protein [Melaminivora suipulveris]